MSGCSSSASTATLSPWTTLKTPSGTPASLSSSAVQQRRGRILLGRLEHERVAARERRRPHPHRDHRREVERRDARRRRRAAGGSSRRRSRSRPARSMPPLSSVREAAAELDHLEPARDLAHRVGEHLAVLGASGCLRDVLAVRRGRARGCAKKSSARLRERERAPGGERLPSRPGRRASTSSTVAKSTAPDLLARSPGCRPGPCGRTAPRTRLPPIQWLIGLTAGGCVDDVGHRSPPRVVTGSVPWPRDGRGPARARRGHRGASGCRRARASSRSTRDGYVVRRLRPLRAAVHRIRLERRRARRSRERREACRAARASRRRRGGSASAPSRRARRSGCSRSASRRDDPPALTGDDAASSRRPPASRRVEVRRVETVDELRSPRSRSTGSVWQHRRARSGRERRAVERERVRRASSRPAASQPLPRLPRRRAASASAAASSRRTRRRADGRRDAAGGARPRRLHLARPRALGARRRARHAAPRRQRRADVGADPRAARLRAARRAFGSTSTGCRIEAMATIETNTELGRQIVEDAKRYVLYSWSVQDAINPIAVERRRGPLLLGLRRQALPRLRLAARQRLDRPLRTRRWSRRSRSRPRSSRRSGRRWRPSRARGSGSCSPR